MKILAFIKKQFFVLIICIPLGIFSAFSVNNHLIHFSYRQLGSLITFLFLIPPFFLLVYIGIYKFLWITRLKNYSTKSKWLFFSVCIALGALFIPPITTKVPVNISISNAEQASNPAKVGIVEIKVEGHSVPFDWFKQKGKWETKKWLGHPGLFSSEEKISSLEYVYESNRKDVEVEILFAESNSTGTAHIQVAKENRLIKTQSNVNGMRKETIIALTPQMSLQWKIFLIISYISDIFLIGIVLFFLAAWGLSSPATKKKSYLLWQKLLQFETESIKNAMIHEDFRKKQVELWAFSRDHSIRKYLSALLFISPPLVAGLYMQTNLPFSRMLFTGGIEYLVANLCFIVLFIYATIFIYALGTLLLPTQLNSDSRRLVFLDITLIRFIAGASILTIIGFFLGILNLLVPYVSIPIFCSVLYIYFLRYPVNIYRFWHWLTSARLISPKGVRKGFSLRHLVIFLNSTILFLVLYIVLVKGIIPDLISSDVQQLYYSYFAEVRLNHGIWIDPAHPIIYDFLIGRGMGVYLFFTSFTNQYFIQIISVIYLISIALIVHQFIFHIIPDETENNNWVVIRNILPACATITALMCLMFITETGKYHLQTDAFITSLSFYSLRILFLDEKQSKWLIKMLLPLVIAMPVAFFQSEFFVIMILLVAGISIYFLRGQQFAKYCVFLLAASIIPAILSLGFNQVYTGIGELNPSSFFLRFANLEKLSQWTSIELINYMNWTQDISGIYPERVLNYLISLIYPIMNIATIASIIGFLLIILGDILKCGVNIQFSKKIKLSKLIIFCSLFLLLPIIWQLLTVLVDIPSVYRLFLFLNLYPSISLFAVVIILLIALQHMIIQTNKFEIKKSKWAILSSIAGVVLLIYSLIQGNKNILPFQFTLVLVSFISIWYAGWFARLIDLFHKVSTFTGVIIPVLACLVTFYVSFDLFRTNTVLPNFSREIGYLTGAEGMIETLPPKGLNYHRCLEILEAVPGEDPVLPLNAYQDIVPCQNSPLLPRNKIVHHYQSVLAPIYKDVLLSDYQTMNKIYQDLGINFFYLEKNNIQFFGPGYSEAFDFKNLIREYDVFWENEDFYILTWRGLGIRPVSVQDAEYIEDLRYKARISDSYYGQSWLALLRLKENNKE